MEPTTEPTAGPAGGADSGPAPSPLAALVGLALAGALLLGWRARRQAPAPVARPARPAPPTPVEGLEYRDDRTLALVGADGEVSSVPTPWAAPSTWGRWPACRT
ncbi:hypothetical protein ACFQDE_05175 [Deinococcus caeni]|uniref:hypothetical protein n=1 Tax=Deinococcus caeni TaxID=569127 RepID=UPI003610F65E